MWPAIVSMARLDDPASASTSFFICTAPAPSLDNKYTAFARVVEGMDVVNAIEQEPLDGEAPRTSIDLIECEWRNTDRIVKLTFL